MWLAGRRFSLVYFINQTYEGCNAGDRAYVEKVRARTSPQPHAILPSSTNHWLPDPIPGALGQKPRLIYTQRV